MLRKILVRALPLTLSVAAAVAQPSDTSKSVKELQKQATKLDNQAGKGGETVFASLSKQLNVPIDTLKSQQARTHFGPGELFIANSLAGASGKTFDQIAQEMKSGKGWGEIAKENNINLGKVVSDLKQANKKVEEDRTGQAQANTHGSGGRESNEAAGSGSRNTPDASGTGSAMGHGHSQSGPGGRR